MIRLFHRNPCNDLILLQIGSFRIDWHKWYRFDYFNQHWILMIDLGFITVSLQKGPGKRYE